ncbi:hypothetical protein ACHAW6_011900 [Cyclotella cf. meneghiniana]
MLSNTKCLVTGASSGIGLATSQVLTKHGAHVVGTGRNSEALSQLKSKGHIVDFVVADIASSSIIDNSTIIDSSSPCKYVVEMANRILGGLTAVVNAAGVLQAGAADAVTVDNYDYNMNTNARASFEIMTHAIPYLKEAAASAASSERKGAAQSNSFASPSIVNISSVNGKQSFPGCISYCMSKAAVDMMTRCASVDLAKYGIRVNSVNPGMVVTNLQKRGGISDAQYEAFLQRSIEVTHPLASYLGRCSTPEEVGELVAFLISDKARFITGECIAMDGGRQNLGAR